MPVPCVRLAEIATIWQGLGFSGRAAGVRAGDWRVYVVGVGDIDDDRLQFLGAQQAEIARNGRTDRHRLQANDVLLTARSTVVKAALFPPVFARGSRYETVADASLLVLRTHEPEAAPWVWWYLTSHAGREQVRARMTGSSTLLSLAASSLAELVLPLPAERDLLRVAELAQVAEQAYGTALEAAWLRRTLFRDEIVNRLRREAGLAGEHA